ncbi:hypothetical protein WN71_035175 [Streptomyces mangrovisoli]|uniref:Uncharacterized protein n=1 Tax=Streptomyces mangrovisoli TaxID=1428628 RepID=A0A1J4NM91_9ACTN|nr:hypothetical protein WN71_035175 [Streptomyces mangrovisoli]
MPVPQCIAALPPHVPAWPRWAAFTAVIILIIVFPGPTAQAAATCAVLLEGALRLIPQPLLTPTSRTPRLSRRTHHCGTA